MPQKSAYLNINKDSCKIFKSRFYLVAKMFEKTSKWVKEQLYTLYIRKELFDGPRIKERIMQMPYDFMHTCLLVFHVRLYRFNSDKN